MINLTSTLQVLDFFFAAETVSTEEISGWGIETC